MKYVLTDENDERFRKLAKELDDGYFRLHGDKVLKYESYNEFKDPHTVLLAIDLNKPVACASYRTFNHDSVEFKRVFVKEEYRKRGIAYDLIKKLEKSVRENDFKYSYIVTGCENYAAINLYRKLNYELIDNFAEFKDDALVICMKKEF